MRCDSKQAPHDESREKKGVAARIRCVVVGTRGPCLPCICYLLGFKLGRGRTAVGNFGPIVRRNPVTTIGSHALVLRAHDVHHFERVHLPTRLVLCLQDHAQVGHGRRVFEPIFDSATEHRLRLV